MKLHHISHQEFTVINVYQAQTTDPHCYREYQLQACKLLFEFVLHSFPKSHTHTQILYINYSGNLSMSMALGKDCFYNCEKKNVSIFYLSFFHDR
jgi:hypothetical protein